MSTTAQTIVSTPRSNMAALCERIDLILSDLPEGLGYALEAEEAELLKSMVEIARKAHQVKGSRMIWSHRGDWFCFKNTELGIMATIAGQRPEWSKPPAKPKLVPVYVPEHLLQAMREHLGILANA